MQPRRLFAATLAAAIMLAAALLLALPIGCSKHDSADPPTGPTAKRDPVHLRLLVVDDPPLARKIGRVRGDWEARADATLEVAEFNGIDDLRSTDVIIYPPAMLYDGAEKVFLPLPKEWLDRPEYERADVFDLIAQHETTWGDQTYAVPLGCPVLVCFYRRDLFEKYHRDPPRTWTEYQRLAEFFADRKNLPGEKLPDDWSGALEPLRAWPGGVAPLDDAWEGYLFLARAAAYAKHRDYYSTLFDLKTMAPRIASPPFVRALNELVTAAKLANPAHRGDSPASVCQAFLAGHSAMALSWPTAADVANDATDASATKPAIGIGFCQCPGSTEVFNPRDGRWEPRAAKTSEAPSGGDDDVHVPLLGAAGRLGSIAASTKHAATAFHLLCWLAGKEWAARICPASGQTTLFRRSQIADAASWVNAGIPAAAAKEYGAVVERSLCGQQWLGAPRLEGHLGVYGDAYMTSLDEGVQKALAGKASAQAALDWVAGQWNKITAHAGIEAQRAAYSRDLGMEP